MKNKNYEFKIYKIKDNKNIINNRYNYNYIEKFLKNKKNIFYSYICYYNVYYKKFFYYDKKNKKYKNYYQILKNLEYNKFLLKDLKKNKYSFKLNLFEKIENFIIHNMNNNIIRKYTIIKIDNDLLIIEKKYLT